MQLTATRPAQLSPAVPGLVQPGLVQSRPVQSRPVQAGRAPLSPARLAGLAGAVAADPGQWRQVVRYTTGDRWYTRLELTQDYEIWLLSWLPGQRTGFHDHGGASGALAVAAGDLLERTAVVGRTSIASRTLLAGTVRSFGPGYLHDVVGAGQPAVSVHAYSPPLALMRRYEMTPAGLAATGQESSDETW
jgi:hypothetical protein